MHVLGPAPKKLNRKSLFFRDYVRDSFWAGLVTIDMTFKKIKFKGKEKLVLK